MTTHLTELEVLDIGEDSEAWLVVSRVDVLRGTLSPEAARLAVISHLREQLLPSEEDAFAACVETVLDAPLRLYQRPILAHDERVFYQSPVGKGAPWNWRIGTCGAAIGFTLLDHHEMAERNSWDAEASGKKD